MFSSKNESIKMDCRCRLPYTPWTIQTVIKYETDNIKKKEFKLKNINSREEITYKKIKITKMKGTTIQVIPFLSYLK